MKLPEEILKGILSIFDEYKTYSPDSPFLNEEEYNYVKKYILENKDKDYDPSDEESSGSSLEVEQEHEVVERIKYYKGGERENFLMEKIKNNNMFALYLYGCDLLSGTEKEILTGMDLLIYAASLGSSLADEIIASVHLPIKRNDIVEIQSAYNKNVICKELAGLLTFISAMKGYRFTELQFANNCRNGTYGFIKYDEEILKLYELSGDKHIVEAQLYYLEALLDKDSKFYDYDKGMEAAKKYKSIALGALDKARIDNIVKKYSK